MNECLRIHRFCVAISLRMPRDYIEFLQFRRRNADSIKTGDFFDFVTKRWLMTRKSLFGVAISLVCLSACAMPAPSGPQKQQPASQAISPAGIPRLTRAFEYRGIDEGSINLVKEKIREFEQNVKQRNCSDIQFAGFDEAGNVGNSDDKEKQSSSRVKAFAMSTCGPTYYWFDKAENGGRISRLNVEARSPVVGDRIFVLGSYGKWERIVMKR